MKHVLVKNGKPMDIANPVEIRRKYNNAQIFDGDEVEIWQAVKIRSKKGRGRKPAAKKRGRKKKSDG